MPIKPASPEVQRGNPLNHGLAGAWLLTEGAGNTSRDSSGIANPLTLTATSWTAGRAGRCLGFNGNTSSAVTGSQVSVGSAFTIACWVNPAVAMSTYPRIVEVDYANAFFLGLDGSGTAFDFIVSGWSLDACIGGTPTIGLWQHVCGVFDNGTGYLYVNGRQVNSYTGAVPSWTGLLYIGEPNPIHGGASWNGLLDDIRYFHAALTAQQVGSLYRSAYDEFRRRGPANGFLYAAGGASLALAAIARGAGLARAAASCAAALSMRGSAVGEGRAVPIATTALMARGGAAGSGQGSTNFGVVAMVARSLGAACGRAGAAFAAELRAASASAGSARPTVSAIARLGVRGRIGSAAVAALSAGAQLAITAQALMVGCARAALALVTPAPATISNPTLEIVAASQQVPPDAKNLLTLTTAGPGIALTATNKGPLQG
jgi:hypothetical protein